MTASLKEKSIPWCTVILVTGTILCNGLVLLGNWWTAEAFASIGTSTKGWSKVGLGISLALVDELDETMKNVSDQVVDGLETVMSVQDELDNILSIIGNTTDDAISNSTTLSLLDKHGPKKGMMLLQEMHGITLTSDNSSALTTLILEAVDGALDSVFDAITELLNGLFETLKPSLYQIANWTSQFSDSIVTAIEEFGSTIDKAQKMFDQAMAQLATSGDNTDVMINNTFNLFDTEGVGSISVDSLISVGEYYAISALSGSKPYELIEKYDRDGDGVLDVDEYTFLVDDPDLTGVMGIVLRNYAKRLAEIAGAVGQATMRSEVASSTADYLRLVCAKNETKVGWIADRLSNNSLVGDFIGSVLVEMCIKNLDPNQPVYTDEDVGETVTTKMYEYNNTILDDMWVYIGNTSWWTDQGFNTQYQPSCAEMLVNWTLAAHEAAREGYPDLALVDVVAGVTLEEGVDKQKVMEAMPKAAFHLAQESVKLAKLEKLQVKKQKRSRMFSTRTGQMLLHRLQGGAMASRRADSEDSADSNAASQAIGGGTAALPTTLEFAKFLSYNATTTSSGYINDCTDYSGESSNSKDGFNSKIKGMLAKAVSFIETFQTYASAEGIAMIEEKFQNFTVNAVAEVKELIEERINGLIIEYEPQLEDSLHQAAYTTGEKIGTLIGSALSDPIAEALSGSIESALEDTIGEEAATEIADTLSDTLGSTISNFSAEYIGEYAGEILDGLIDQALESGGDILNNSLTKLKSAKLTPAQAKKLKAKGLSLSQQSSKRVELKHDLASISSLDAEIDALFASSNRQVMKARKAALYHERSEAGLSADLSSSWTDVYNLMTSFYNLIPQAVEVLKDAKEDVSTMASNLNSIFDSLEEKGPAIFDAVEMYWKIIWGVYFLFIMPFCVFTLYYGFWASGWFGGPQALSEDDVAPVPPTDFSGRVKTLCNSCCHCCKGFHDTHTCFWSVIILMQVMVLLTFLISIVLIIIAGVEFMMSSSCAAVYVVEDTDSCTQALETIQSWMATFSIDGNLLTNQTIGAACDEYSLLTCQMISTKLSSAAIYCAGFSFLASVFSLQMVFDSATLHEQAVCRRKAATLRLKAEGRF